MIFIGIAAIIGALVFNPTPSINISLAQVKTTTSDQPSSLGVLFEQIQGSVVQVISKSSELVAQSSPKDKTSQAPKTNSNDFLEATGFVYDTAGHIITSFSGVQGLPRTSIILSDDSVYNATVIGFDESSDIAVLQAKGVPREKLVPLKFIDNSSDLKVGETVAMIGNPSGLLNLLKDGIISGVNLSVPDNVTKFSIPHIFAMNIVANDGDSGAPIFNNKGEVLGMFNNFIGGITFALPSNTIRKEVPFLIATGGYRHAWLGVSGATLDFESANALGLKNYTRGVYISEVTKGSPADLAGLSAGASKKYISLDDKKIRVDTDIIVGIGSNKVQNFKDILNYIDDKNVGDTVALKVLRNGTLHDFNAELKARP
jgi:S1-C subfamily serine protease